MPEFCSAAGCQNPDRGLRCLACEAIICAHHAVPVAFDPGNEEDPIIHPLCGRCWDGVRRTAKDGPDA